MKRLLILIVLLPVLVQATPILGGNAEVTIITCTPGDELYSVFGHSAIRINEPGRIDYVYNYGTFQFSDDFYLQFARGKLNYRLSRSNFDAFNYEYIVTGRGVYEQVLDLDSLQAQRLFDFLEVNYLPENRFYLYDFFYDNCATRVRDVLNDVFGPSLTYQSSFAPDSATFRNMIDMYLIGMPWADFGIDIALGAPCDRKVQAQQNMFLPDFVHYELSLALLDGRALVRESRELLPPQFLLQKARYNVPVILAACAMAIMFALLLQRVIAGRSALWPLRVLLVLSGLIGVAVALLWFATDHVTTPNNWNLVWAFPLHLVLAFRLKRRTSFFKYYIRAFTAVYFLFALTSWFWPQEFHVASYLLGVALLFTFLNIGMIQSRKTA